MRALETPRLLLRRLRREDTQAIFENWANDPEVTKYLTWQTHESVETTEQVMDLWLGAYDEPNCYRYGIQRKEDGALMGMIDVVGYHHGNPVIGYCSGRAFWNHGYMTEALRAVVEELQNDGYGTIVIEAVEENIGSRRVIEKAGFTHVGSRRCALSAIKPRIVTIHSYRMYKRD